MAVAFSFMLISVVLLGGAAKRVCHLKIGSTLQTTGKELYEKGQYKAALDCFLISASTRKESGLYSNIAATYVELAMYKEAEESVMTGLGIDPNCYTCLQAAGVIYVRQKRFVDALSYDSLRLRRYPQDVDARLQIADDLQNMNMYYRSLYYVEAVIFDLKPTDKQRLQARVQAALAKRYLGELVGAMKHSREAVTSSAFKADNTNILKELGYRMYCDVSLALGVIGNVHDAATKYVNDFPHAAEAVCFASIATRASWELNPELMKVQRIALDKVVDTYSKLVKKKRFRDFTCSPYVFLHFDYSPAEIKNISQILSNMEWIKMREKRKLLQNLFEVVKSHYTQAKKLRIGFISGWFFKHEVGFSLFRVLAKWANSSKQEIFIYMLSQYHDEITTWFKRSFGDDHFGQLHWLDTDQAVSRIFADKIHILVDLMGHFYTARHDILAARPAPVQVAYMGYPATTGSQAIDYFVCDPVACPNPDHFTEKLIHLPVTPIVAPRTWAEITSPAIWYLDHIADNAITREKLGLKGDDFVYCFVPQRHYMGVDPLSFSAWAEILKQTPQSHLVMFFVSKVADKNAHRGIEDNGLQGRVHLYRQIEQYQGQMELAAVCDLCLESFVYNSYFQAADLLNQGIPVLALLGVITLSRMTASVIVGSGQGKQLVARTREEYIFRAIQFWKNPQELRMISRELKNSKKAQDRPLFNSGILSLSLEETMQRIWDTHIRGRPPEPVLILMDEQKYGSNFTTNTKNSIEYLNP